MSFFRSLVAPILGGTLTLLLAACGTPPIEPRLNPPEVRLGPVLELLKVNAAQDLVRVVSNAPDQVHVLIASKPLRQVLYIAVGPKGIIEQQLIRANVSPSTIDATFDGQGRLHVLIDSEHLVLENKAWRAAAPTVWQDAGVTVERPGFVHGAHQLLWTFTAFGKDMGATPGRRVWRGGGGGYPAGAFLIYPWNEQTRKAVVVADGAGGDIPWNVPDPQSKFDTSIIDAVADSAGTVHLVYATGYNVDLAGTFSFLSGLVTREAAELSLRYVRLDTKDLRSATPTTFEPPKQPDEVHLLRDIAGSRRLDWPYTHTRLPLAVDPVTGSALLGDRWFVKGDKWTALNLTTSAFPVGSPPEKIAAAGHDRFHAIAIANIDHRFMGRTGIEYSMLSKGEWSSPLWLSTAGTLSLMGPTVVDMASTGNGNAFVVWSTENGFVGRWVEHTR